MLVTLTVHHPRNIKGTVHIKSCFNFIIKEDFFTCKFCIKDLFVLLPDLLLVVFEQALTQVAHLPQRKRRLVLP